MERADERDVEVLAREVVDAAYHIHSELGPGLLESVYEAVLARVLEKKGFLVERQKDVAFEFDGMTFRDGLRADMFVNARLLVELKSVESLSLVHRKQVLTYLRLMRLPLGLLINFGGATIKEGVRRIVNGHTEVGSSSLRIHQIVRPE